MDLPKVMIESSAASTHHSQLIQTTPFFSNGSDRNTDGSQIDLASNSPRDKVTISPEAKSIRTRLTEEASNDNETQSTEGSTGESTKLTTEEQREVTKLQRRDAEVRAHEQAHLSAAGRHAAGGMSFTYEVGPDGKRYAIGGEVPIDLSREKTPEETIAKMQQVAKAALAPVNPSAADRNIAARANSIAADAQREVNSADVPGKKPDGVKNESTEDNQAGSTNDPFSSEYGTIEVSNSPSFMPSRQTVLRAYVQNS